jgi:hypothetical protein
MSTSKLTAEHVNEVASSVFIERRLSHNAGSGRTVEELDRV